MTTNENRLLLYNASDKKHTIIWMIYMRKKRDFSIERHFIFHQCPNSFREKVLEFYLVQFLTAVKVSG